jgi:hypothetical protein
MNASLERSVCVKCIHFRRLYIAEMKKVFSLHCAAQNRYVRTPRRSCSFYEPITWESFLDNAGGIDED